MSALLDRTPGGPGLTPIEGGLLEVTAMTKRFGGLTAVDSVDLTVQPGQITALIGPNGAGKTTMFNCLSGVLTPTSGAVSLDGQDISGLPVHKRAQLGLGRTFQRLEVFSGMTVRDNLLVAAEQVRSRREHGRRGAEAVADEALAAVGLQDRQDLLAGELSTGVLRLVELGRALAIRPRVLLLDEPASGLDSTESLAFEGILREVAASGISVLIVEHDVEMVMRLSDTIYVVDFGKLIASGTPVEVSNDPAVRKAYLGEQDDDADH